MYMGKWIHLTNTDYEHSLTIVEGFQFSRRLSFVLGEHPRAWMVPCIHNSSVFCRLTGGHKSALSPPWGAKSEFVISGFDVDFSPWLLPNARLGYRCFWICLFGCGCIIHTEVKLLFSKYLMAHPVAVFGMHLPVSAHLGLATGLLWPVERQRWADTCPGSGTSGVPGSGSWWLCPSSLGPASSLTEQTRALNKPISQSAVAL